MNLRSASSFIGAGVFVAFAVACGGSTATAGGGGGSGGASSGGVGPGGNACPATAPSPQTSCPSTLESVSCEYGADPNLSCNTVLTCQSGKWQSASSSGSSSTCPTPAAAPPCPVSYAAAQVAGACTAAGASCAYPQGRCECAVSTSGPPSIGGKSSSWLCDDPGAGCPMPRPHLGSPCTQVGQQCPYGACSIPDGVNLVCTAGVWQTAASVCAL